MQYSRQDIIEEIKKIFKTGAPLSPPPPLSEQLGAATSGKSGTPSAVSQKSSVPTTGASTGNSSAAATSSSSSTGGGNSNSTSSNSTGASTSKKSVDPDIHNKLDTKYQVIVKTIRILRAQDPWDFESFEFKTSGKGSGEADRVSPDTAAGTFHRADPGDDEAEFETDIFSSYEYTYRELGYDLVFEKIKRTLLSPPQENAYLSRATSNWQEISNSTLKRLGPTISNAARMYKKTLEKNLKSPKLALSGQSTVFVMPSHPSSPYEALKKSKQKSSRLAIKQIRAIIEDSLESDPYIKAMPLFRWPLYTSRSLAPEFGVYWLRPRYHALPRKKIITKIVVGKTKEMQRYSFALGWGNWAFAASHGVASPSKRLAADEVKKQMIEGHDIPAGGNPGGFPGTTIDAGQAAGIVDKMKWHRGAIEGFRNAVANNSTADENVVNQCIKMMDNYIVSLDKLIGLVPKLSYSRLYNWQVNDVKELVLHGGIIGSSLTSLMYR